MTFSYLNTQSPFKLLSFMTIVSAIVLFNVVDADQVSLESPTANTDYVSINEDYSAMAETDIADYDFAEEDIDEHNVVDEYNDADEMESNVLSQQDFTTTLDESHVSENGWTQLHKAIHGDPVATRLEDDGTVTAIILPPEDIVLAMESATDEYLCKTNDYKETAVHFAVRSNDYAVLEYLVNTRQVSCLDAANEDGDTALRYAQAWDLAHFIELLSTADA